MGETSLKKSQGLGDQIWNVPNQVTVARIFLALFCFVAMSFQYYSWALGMFVIAAGTDFVDGYWARKYGLVTQLGRILDPFADKMIICGIFVYLASVPQANVGAWVAVVVVVRELLVTVLRSFFEQQGIDFSANWSGKWKMLFQCLAVVLCLYRLTYLDVTNHEIENQLMDPNVPEWLESGVLAAVWLAVLSTIYSGWGYMKKSWQMLSGS